MNTQLRQAVEFIGVRSEVKKDEFDLVKTIMKSIDNAGIKLQDGDVIIVSSKFVSMSEGNVVGLKDIQVSPKAKALANKLAMDERLAELVTREADTIFGGVPGFALTTKDGVLAPNAGVDTSNVQSGLAIVYPRRPFKKAESIRRAIRKETGKDVGIILSDSRLIPTRIGTIGLAIGVAGIRPIEDDRGRTDLFGKPLKVTRRAIADDLATGAQLLMGEADEAVPIVIARSKRREVWRMTNEEIKPLSMVMNSEKCIYVQGLSEGIFH